MSENKIVADQHAIIGNTEAGSNIHFERTTHPSAKWFYEPTQLGLFIHFGIPAVHGDLDISWGMMDNPIRRKGCRLHLCRIHHPPPRRLLHVAL